MRISLSAAAFVAACLCLSCDPVQAQTGSAGSSVTIRQIIGTAPQPEIGFTGVGTPCSNYGLQFFSATTNTHIACINTGNPAASVVGTYTIVNSGGTSGLPSSGTNTIPYVVTGGNTQPATAANVVSLFNSGGCSGFLKSDGTCAAAATNLPSVTTVLKGNGSGNALAATSADVISLFSSGSCSGFLKSDGTCATVSGGGATIPNTTSLLKGSGTGNGAAAGVTDVTGLFTGTGQYLRADGTTGTPSGGGASLPSTTAILKGDGSGGAAPANAASVVGLFGSCTGSQILSGAGTCINAPAASIPSGTTASVPASGTAGGLYNVTDASSGLPYYFYNASGSAVKLLDSGPSGALSITNNQVDIITSVVPRLNQNNTFSGSNTFNSPTTVQNLTVTGTCTGCNSSGFANPMTASGDLIAGGTGGAAARLGVGADGQVLTASGGQPIWSTPAASSSYSSITQDSGDASITVTNGSGYPFRLVSTQNDVEMPIYCGTSGTGSGDCHNLTVFTAGYGMGFKDISRNVIPVIYKNDSVASGGRLEIRGGATLATGGLTQPSCDSGSGPAGLRGMLWVQQSASGTADHVQACLKAADDSYAWRTIY